MHTHMLMYNSPSPGGVSDLKNIALSTSFFVLLSSIEDGGAPRLKIPTPTTGSNGFMRIFWSEMGFEASSRTFLLRFLLFLLSKPFQTRTFVIFDPPKPSKSSIFIERVVICEGLNFCRSKAFFGPSREAFWPNWGPSWGLLGPSWRHFEGPKRRGITGTALLFDVYASKCASEPPRSPQEASKRLPKGPQKAPQGIK